MEQDAERGPIVVGVHGSRASLAALRWAAREAGLRRVALQVVRAWEDEGRQLAPYASRLRAPGGPGSRAAAADGLELAVHAVAGQAFPVTVTAELADGPPARVLLERTAGAGLLVLGSATREALGPVARVCLSRAPCPVVLVTERRAGLLMPA